MKIRCFIINIAVASMIFFAITVVRAGNPPLLSIIQEDRYVKGQTSASNQQYGYYDDQSRNYMRLRETPSLLMLWSKHGTLRHRQIIP